MKIKVKKFKPKSGLMNEKLIKKAMLYLLMGVMITSISACGKKKEKEEVVNREIVHIMPADIQMNTPKPESTPKSRDVLEIIASMYPEPTATPVPEPTQTPEPTTTPVPDSTQTPEPTATPVPEPIKTPEPTATPVPEPTQTPEPTATPTPEPSQTPEPTATPAPEPTQTPEPTATPVPEPIQTSSLEPEVQENNASQEIDILSDLNKEEAYNIFYKDGVLCVDKITDYYFDNDIENSDLNAEVPFKEFVVDNKKYFVNSLDYTDVLISDYESIKEGIKLPFTNTFEVVKKGIKYLLDYDTLEILAHSYEEYGDLYLIPSFNEHGESINLYAMEFYKDNIPYLIDVENFDNIFASNYQKIINETDVLIIYEDGATLRLIPITFVQGRDDNASIPLLRERKIVE